MPGASLPRHSNVFAAGAKMRQFCFWNSLLWSDLQKYKRARNGLWTRTWVVRRGLSCRLEVGRFGEDVMRLRIQRHGAGAELRVHVAHDGVLVRRVLVNHGQQSFAASGKNQSGTRIESVAIRVAANSRSR